jgi:hypothetical protein
LNEFPTWHNALWSAVEAMDAGMFKSAHEFFAAGMKFDRKEMNEKIVAHLLPTDGRTLDLAHSQNTELILVAPSDPFWWGVRSETWLYLLTMRIGMPIAEVGDTAQAQFERMGKAAISDAIRLVEHCPGNSNAYLHRAKIHHILNEPGAADRDRATAAGLTSNAQSAACA